MKERPGRKIIVSYSIRTPKWIVQPGLVQSGLVPQFPSTVDIEVMVTHLYLCSAYTYNAAFDEFVIEEWYCGTTREPVLSMAG